MAKKLTDDFLKWTLDIDGKPAIKALGDLEQKTRALEQTNKALSVEMQKLEANGKKNSAEYKRLSEQYRQNNTTITQSRERMAELRREVGTSGLSIAQLRRQLNTLKRDFDNATPGTAEWRRLNAEIQQTRARLNELNGATAQTNGVFGALKGFLPALGFAAVAAGVKELISNVIEVRSEFSKYEAVLRNTLGSQEAAARAMGMLKDFAATTPFQLSELTGSYVKLVNMGFNPTREEMVKLGDLASSTGKSFEQLTEAVLDAQVGENERLKEFGVRAEKNGDIIKYTFKGVTTEVQNNAEAIRAYVLGLGEAEGVAGSMAAISKTVGGAISNSKDATDNLLNTIGAKLEPLLVNIMTWYSDSMNKFSEWINGSGEGFTKLYNWFAEFYNASMPLRAGIELIEVGFRNTFAMVNLLFSELWNTLKSTGELIKAIFTGDFASIPDILSTRFSDAKQNVTTYAKKLGENAVNAWNDSVNGKIELKVNTPGTVNQSTTGSTKKTGGTTGQGKVTTDDLYNQLSLEEAKKTATDRLAEFEEWKKEQFTAEGSESFLFQSLKLSDEEVEELNIDGEYAAELYQQSLDGQLAALKANFDAKLIGEQEYIAKSGELKQQQFAAEMEIQSAKAKLYSDAFGTLASLVGEETKLGKALFVAQQAATIANIIFQTAIANAKAVAISPITGGQPWVGINTASAAISIAGVVGQTWGKLKKKATGGFTGDQAGLYADAAGRKYIAGEAGDEWIAPNWMLRSPSSAPLIRMLEAQRTGKASVSQAIPQFAAGGSTATASNQFPESGEMVALLRQIAAKDSGIKLYDDNGNEFRTFQKAFNQILKDAKNISE